MVIQGSNPLDYWGSNKSSKRMWKDIVSIASTSATGEGPVRPPLAFADNDLHDGRPNLHIPLLISAIIANMEVRRILVDQGSAVDVIFEDLLKVLKISPRDITPYRGKDLTGFNGASTRPLGHLELMVTYGDPDGKEAMFRTVKTAFLVLPCKSVYQCIIGRPTLGKLEAVTSTVHLKMKFYNLENKVVTIQADLDAAKRCYFLGLRHEKTAAGIHEVSRERDPVGEPGLRAEVDMTDLDARYDPDPEEEEDSVLAKELKNRMKRPEPDGEFISI